MTFDVWIWLYIWEFQTWWNSCYKGWWNNTEVGTGYEGGYHAFQGNPIGNPPLGGPIYLYIYIMFKILQNIKISTNLDLQI